MEKAQNLHQDKLSIGKAAEYLGVSIDTLRRWEQKNIINAYRSPGGHRYFIKNDLRGLFEQKYTRVQSPSNNSFRPQVEVATNSQVAVTSTNQVPTQTSLSIPSQQSTLWQKIFTTLLIILVLLNIALVTIYILSSKPLLSPILN